MAKFGSKSAGKMGGEARAKNLSKEERSEIARAAAEARWAKEGKAPLPKAIHGSPDRPLRIKGLDGEEAIEIQAYVLDDERRVLSQRGVIGGMGMKRGGREGGDRLTHWMDGKSVSPFVSSELRLAISSPILFRGPNNTVTHGYEATILLDICEAVLEARRQGHLYKNQQHIAARCEILVRGLSRVGIIALVDEATGYQRDRARDELAKILEAFVAKEIQKWIKTFDLEFYELICELRGLPLDKAKKRPKYFGLLTNNLVYNRLAPGVLEQLKHISPADEKGNRKTKLFQGLTPDYGHPKLKEHLAGVTAAMRMAKFQGMRWEPFIKLLDLTHPPYKDMPLFDDESE